MAKFNFYVACIVAAFVAQGLAAPSNYYGNAAPAGAEATPCETVDAAAACVPATVVATTYVTSTCTEATTATTTMTVTQPTTVMETVTSASVVAVTSTCTETASTMSTVTVPTYTTTTLYVCPDCAPNAVGTQVAETPCETSTSPYEAGAGEGAGVTMTTEYASGGNYAAPTETAAPAGESTQYTEEQQDETASGAGETVMETIETIEGEPLPVDDASIAGGEETTDAMPTDAMPTDAETSTETSTETTVADGSAAASSPAYVEPIYDGAAQSSSATNYRRRRRV